MKRLPISQFANTAMLDIPNCILGMRAAFWDTRGPPYLILKVSDCASGLCGRCADGRMTDTERFSNLTVCQLRKYLIDRDIVVSKALKSELVARCRAASLLALYRTSPSAARIRDEVLPSQLPLTEVKEAIWSVNEKVFYSPRSRIRCHVFKPTRMLRPQRPHY